MNCHATTTSPIPRSHLHVLRDPHWHKAKVDECNALISNETWVLVPRPTNVNIVRSMWLFRHKCNADGSLSRYKARLVANGRSQQQGIDCDETFSPVVKPTTIRTVVRYMGLNKLRGHGFSGLRALLPMLVFSTAKPIASSTALLQRIIKVLHGEFAMIDLGSLNYFLSISTQRTKTGLFLSQSKFAKEILERAHMQHCNPCKTPVDTESKLGSDGDSVIQQICLYMHDPRGPHFHALKRILRYVRGTLDHGLQLHVRLSRSSAEVEYHGVANVVAEAAWIRNLLLELHAPLTTATLVYCDKVRVLHVPSCFQYADIFTKGLPTALFLEFRSSLNVRRPPVTTTGEYYLNNNNGDGIVHGVLYDLTKPQVPSCSEQIDHVGLLHDQHGGFTLSLLESLFSKGLRRDKSIPPKCRLGFSHVLKGALDKVICKPDDISCWVSLLVLPLCLLKTFFPRSNLESKSANKRRRQEKSIINAIRSWSMPSGSLQLVRETLAESSPPMLDVDEEDLDLSEQNLKQCKRKICDGHYTAAFPRSTSCGRDGLRAQHLMDCLSGAVVAILDELVSSITQVVNLFLDGKCPIMLGEYNASAPLTPIVKPGGGIRPIVVGTFWRRLVSKVSNVMIVHSLDGYLDDLQFGVGVLGGGEAILHAVNRLIEDRGDDVGLLMLLVDFKNAFNLVDRKVMLVEVRLRCPAISRWVELCYSSPTRLYYGEHTLWSCQGVQQGDLLGPLLFSLVLHPLIYPRSTVKGVFPHNISRPLHGVKLLGGVVSVDFGFSSELVMKRVAKTIVLMDAVAKINDPQCELLLLRACTGIYKLYFAMRTCPPRVFESAQRSFDVALRSALERIVTASGPGFGDWQWRLATLP
ncbi:putative reverse transcriptase domain-containing protein [Tanacetum coccineum]|uniref:Reverse transcriptase domain-containing protein n=1 Tax=Tanacetum coccineum TaxID=301880 RepID=A0ABQ5ED05_9ASTR